MTRKIKEIVIRYYKCHSPAPSKLSAGRWHHSRNGKRVQWRH